MKRHAAGLAALLLVFITSTALAAPWPAPKAPVAPHADGYVVIPNVAVPPQKLRVYKTVFDATGGAEKPDQLMPALNMAGSELNAFGVCGVPLRNVNFAIVIHGAAIDGILDDAHYRATFGVPNPNLPLLAELKKAGVKLFVCGQNLAFANIDPTTLSRDVQIASDALIVEMTYQAMGYGLLSF